MTELCRVGDGRVGHLGALGGNDPKAIPATVNKQEEGCLWRSGREPERVSKLDQLSGGGEFRQTRPGRHHQKSFVRSLEAGTEKRGHGR